MTTRRSKLTARTVFAANVKRVRSERGLSQEGLAAISKLHRTYIGSIERAERNVSIDNMEKIANAIGVHLADLLRDGER